MSVPVPSSPSQREIIRRTSRTFAISMQALPRGMREPVQVAYLLARAADTIADTELVPAQDRIGFLSQLRQALFTGENAEGLVHVGDATQQQGGAAESTGHAEAALLSQIGPLLARHRALGPEDRLQVADVVDRLAETMQGELSYFSPGQLLALPDRHALGAYTEGIAGCVGAFWTRLIDRHVRALDPALRKALEIEGRRYGRGLQLVNILRDLPRDLRRGVCFLPGEELEAEGLAPADLLDPVAADPLAPILRHWETRARRGLCAGLLYSARLPRLAFSTRVATALPAAIGLATLRRLAESPARLDPEQKISISKMELRKLVARTAMWCICPRGPLRLN